MLNSLKYISLILFTVIGFLTLREEYNRSDYALFDNELFGVLYLLCFFLALTVAISSIIYYRREKKLAGLLPILLPIMFFTTIVILKIEREKKRNMPVLFTAGIGGFYI